MRRLPAIVVSLALLLACFGIAKAQLSAHQPLYTYDPLHGKLPDANVRNWIRLVILRPRNSLAPIFLISPEHFEVADPEILIQLPKRQYDLIAEHTRAGRCARSDVPVSQLFLEVTEHTRDGTHVPCRMTRPEACRYLNGVARIPGIVWRDRRWEMLRLVRSGFGC